jgi:dimethylhistidine N-methyltransferase
MKAPATSLRLQDHLPPADHARAEILAGLRARPKRLPPKYFYDERGSALFDAICEQPEYYPTRTELGIMCAHAADIAEALGEGVMVVELGSGSSVKIRLLLDALRNPCAYVPVDISRGHLTNAASRINTAYPALEVLPVCADFTQPFRLPVPKRRPARVAVYFPGSTIGNFEPMAAQRLLELIRLRVGEGGALLIGVDLKKEVAVLHAAYNDAAGVTAEFNRNILAHVNRLADTDFDPEGFDHRAFYNAVAGRIEMHLVSRGAQRVRMDGAAIEFAGGETIHTENSYKYAPEEFAALAARAGFTVERVWTDPGRLFSVQLLRAGWERLVTPDRLMSQR